MRITKATTRKISTHSAAEMILDAAPGRFTPDTTADSLFAFLDIQAALAEGEMEVMLCRRIALILVDSYGSARDKAKSLADAKQAGLSEIEILNSLRETCDNSRTNAILHFVRMLVAKEVVVPAEPLPRLSSTGSDGVGNMKYLVGNVLENITTRIGKGLIPQPM